MKTVETSFGITTPPPSIPFHDWLVRSEKIKTNLGGTPSPSPSVCKVCRHNSPGKRELFLQDGFLILQVFAQPAFYQATILALLVWHFQDSHQDREQQFYYRGKFIKKFTSLKTSFIKSGFIAYFIIHAGVVSKIMIAAIC